MLNSSNTKTLDRSKTDPELPNITENTREGLKIDSQT